MLTELRIQNFKSWADTGEMRFAPITGLFGANSSGKTSILQFLLLLKQTVEATDRSRVLFFGDERSLVNLRSFFDVVYQHETINNLEFSFSWNAEEFINSPLIQFHAVVGLDQSQPVHHSTLISKLFRYKANNQVFGLEKVSEKALRETLAPASNKYRFVLKGKNSQTRYTISDSLPYYSSPLHFYGFPGEINRDVQFGDTEQLILSDLALGLEGFFGKIFYLGPLRESPHTSYFWGGESLRDVGVRGELAIPALLAARFQFNRAVEEHVARWLKKMRLIHDFSLKPLGENRREYEVRIQQHPGSAEVLLTDVGFGVSQLLPVLVLCYYVPEGSILLLEQPEIHLHPSVQADLADVFVEVAKTRNLQIILESHSEHLLRRLQRRIAEEQISTEQTALYFCEMKEGVSHLMSLQVDEYGNINNWPQDFFGDEMGDLVALTDAAMKRMQAKGE
jgi:ABC-type dipeptide/oligopeptide/nickel transport system ATPase subunit